MNIQNYNDFVAALLFCGFSTGGGNDGVFALIPWTWNEAPHYDTPVRWHTGDPATDPWEWRMRVLDERSDIAYAKVFFKKSGFITQEWYPYFLSARRGRWTFQEKYLHGTISHEAKRIYDVLQDEEALPLQGIKELARIPRADKSKFDRGLIELQMGLFITICGRQQKISRAGLEYGWSSTVFTTTERFWRESVFEAAAKIDEGEAVEIIAERIQTLNPHAEQKAIRKFIKGS